MKSKNLKRLLALLLVLAMAFSVMAMMTACSDEDEDEDDKKSSDEDGEDEKKKGGSYYVLTGATTYYGEDEDGSGAIKLTYEDGCLTSVSSGEITLNLKYDSKGQVSGLEYDIEDEDIVPPEYTLTWEDGHLVEMQMEQDETYSSTEKYIYEDGKLVQAISTNSSDVKSVTYYDEHGNEIKREVFYDGDEEPGYWTVSEHTYDEDDRLLKTREVSDGNEEYATVTEYTYDENGNLVERKNYDSNGELSSTVKYTYEKVEMTKSQYQIYLEILKKFLGF